MAAQRDSVMSVRWKWVVLWSLWAARLVRQPTAPVRVAGGLARGAVAPDGSHNHYLALPYATVTTRFQDPGPEPTWEGIYEAVNENVRCHQRIGDNIVIGQEDCLVLNVYTPTDAAPGSLLPVMFFIHGGGYYAGSASKFLYGPEYLVSKGVILVTVNYRLNIQGFLCLGIKEAPGNAGMKDQVSALKWVKRNIRVFGGDPDNVTIFGESAGGVSVSYHILSPMSKGLFHKAILQSGSALSAWGHQFRPVYIASLLAKVMGYNTQDPNELYKIFSDKTDGELVVTRVPRKEGNICVSEVLFVPCAEKRIEGVEPFLTDVPYNILTKGEYNKVPMIVGTNNEEGFLFVAIENDTVISNISFEKSLPKDLILPSEGERKVVADKLKEFYMGDDEISNETKLKLSKLHGELYFNYPSLEETEIILKTSDKPIYNYLFSYSGWRNLAKLSLGNPFASATGATHADELFYLFKLAVAPPIFENDMINMMTTLWTNFAKYGEPTPAHGEPALPVPARWDRTLAAAPSALVLDHEPGPTPLWHSRSLLYWRELYARYRRTSD